MQKSESISFFEKILNNTFVRGNINSYDAFLHTVKSNHRIEETNISSHWHCIELDGNGRERTRDFVKNVFYDITDYVIPRSRIFEAKQKDEDEGTSRNFSKLVAEARTTFVDIIKSGELGELILFILAEKFLKLPQVICKMNLKTSSNMHFHGADGVYIGPVDNTHIALYWGESKVHKNFSNAIKECFSSLATLLNSEGGLFSSDNRDFILLSQFIDLNDGNFENVLRNYLDKDNPNFNKVEIRAIAFVGFEDAHCYPQEPNSKTIQDVEQNILKKIPRLQKMIKIATKTNSLESFVIHFFCIPFKSVDILRNEFHRCLGISGE